MRRHISLLFLILYSFALCKDVYPYYNDPNKQFEFEKKRIYIIDEKGERQIIKGGGSEIELANPIGYLLLDENPDYVSSSKPFKTEYEYYYNFIILKGQEELNEFEFMELISLEDKVREIKKEFTEKIKKYESQNDTTFVKYKTKLLGDNKLFNFLTAGTAVLGAIFFYASFKTATDDDLNAYGDGTCEICDWGYVNGIKLMLVGGISYLVLKDMEIKTEEERGVWITNYMQKPILEQTLSSQQIKSLAEAYNRRLYEEIKNQEM